jgi:hypothetical protein
LRDHFGSASWETQVLRGGWQHQGVVFEDNLTRFLADVPDLPRHRKFFKDYKGRLKKRFKQLDIWISSHPVDII